ncbi:MAG: hypothetical protein HUJ31_14910 [Pseudomonadales bacterium]|nr:hypothetical protein [Pseudomonadales bacterium]
MALMVLSIVLSIILGCILWLILGEKFPVNDEPKLPPLNNIVIYSLLSLIPVYLVIFFLYVADQ